MALLHPTLSTKLTSFAVLATFVVGAACSSDNPATTAPTPIDVELSPTVVTLILGIDESTQLDVAVAGSPNQAVTYTVDNPGVVSVSNTGRVTALTEGTTFVTVRPEADPSKNRSVVVNVVSTIVSVTPGGGVSWVGGPTRQFSAAIQNNSNTAVTWSSSNAAVATVSQTGVVTPVGVGTTQIVATSQGDPSKQDAKPFVVVDPPDPTATLIQPGVPVTGLAAAVDDDVYLAVPVPPGATSLVVTVSNANGDLDLFVQLGSLPPISYSTAFWASPTRCGAWTASGNETCTVSFPTGGIFYIRLNAYEAFSNTTVTATVN